MTLDDNQLTGPLPPELGRLQRMMWLWMGANDLSGPIPLEFVSMPLKTFHWGDTDLCAPLDETFQAWLRTIEDYGGGENCVPEAEKAALVRLYETTGGPNWTNNEGWLTNEPVGNWYGVDTEAGRVTNLQLNDNALDGPLPAELGNLSSLMWLGLSNNDLVGPIPPELGGLGNLKWLSIRHTRLTGQIPPELGDLTNLEGLNLDANELTGSLPAELGSLTNLRDLRVWNNRLTGKIPPELGDLTNLEALMLNSNELTGPLPSELGGLASLQGLWIWDNRLTGPIPLEFVNLSLTMFHWGNNDLCAPVRRNVPGMAPHDRGLRRRRELRAGSGEGGSCQALRDHRRPELDQTTRAG